MNIKDIIMYGLWAALVAVISFTITSFSHAIEKNQSNILTCQQDVSAFKFEVAANYSKKDDLLRMEAKIDKLNDLLRQIYMEENKR